MNCTEMEEFVSAMCDGESVPHEAAEHIAHCAACQDLLQSFTEMGTELRIFGRSQGMEPVPERRWVHRERNITKWWKKGWQMMRVPRIAFAALLLLLVSVGSRLALLEVRAHEDGSVLLLKLTYNDGTTTCAMSTVDTNMQQCSGVQGVGGKSLAYVIRYQKKDAGRALLSIYSKAGQSSIRVTKDMTDSMSEAPVWITPGEPTDVVLGGFAKAKLTSEWSDHVPVVLGSDVSLDPSATEIRLTEPLLLKDQRFAGQMGGMASATHAGAAAYVYFPNEGRFIFSLAPFDGGVAGKLDFNRVRFQSDGHDYLLVTGAPIARGEAIWVKHDPLYNPDKEAHGGVIGAGQLSKL